MGLIQTLIDEGALVLYHDYRAGHMLDLSGNGNDGVPTDVVWQGEGVGFPLGTSVITVADSPELQFTDGSLVILVNQLRHGNGTERILSKRDAGGANYSVRFNGTNLDLYDGTSGKWFNATAYRDSARYVSINMGDGVIGEVFMDGLSVGNLNVASAIAVNDAPLLIGNYYLGGSPTGSIVQAALIINRVLTATEHALLYSELVNLTWPTKRKAFAKGSATVPQTQFKTDFGGKTVTAVGAAAQMPGTNYYVNSGNFNLIMDTIDGISAKAIECGASGGYQVANVEMQGDPGDDAYGTWTGWFNKAAGSTYIINFVSDDIAGTNGYSFRISATEVVSLVHNGVGNLFTSAAGYVLADTWYKVTITRDTVAGEFHVYIDGTLVVAATGANPVAENTVTESTYVVYDVDTGDKSGHSSVNGNYGLVKQAGVNAP